MKSRRPAEFVCVLVFQAALLTALTLMQCARDLGAQEPPNHAEKPAVVGEPTRFPPGHVLGGKAGDLAVKSIVLTRFGGGQCSGTLISPRLKSGHYHILTAWHCDARGGFIKVRLHDQRVIEAVSVYADQRSDIRWLQTVRTDIDGLPLATLAREAPKVGTAVWHRSFGVDTPGNLEKGQVTRLPNSNGQTEFRISVSPGDSGGASFRASDDHVLGPWCCTTRLAGVGRVWAGSSVIAWHLRPGFATRATADAVAATWSDAATPSVPAFAPVLLFAGNHH